MEKCTMCIQRIRRGTRKAKRDNKIVLNFNAKLRVDTEIEKKYLFNGGVLQFVLRDMVSSS